MTAECETPTAGADDVQWMTLSEAAEVLGLSVDRVRRRLKAGEFEARQVTTRHGPTWQIRADTLANSPGAPTVAPRVAPRVADSPTISPTVAAPPRVEEQAAMVELVRLVGRLQEENRNLAGQVGFYQAQLEQARETIRMLEPPAESETEVVQGEPHEEEPDPPRRWWQFWRQR